MEGNGRQLKYLQFYSFIMNRVDGYGNGISVIERDSINKEIKRLRFVNEPILYLFRTAVSEGIIGEKMRVAFSDTRLILDVKDTYSIQMPKDKRLYEKWKNIDKNAYTYEILLPAGDSKKIYRKMREDLEFYFNLQARIEKRKVKCLILVKESSRPIPAPADSKADGLLYFDANKNIVYSNNTTIGQLAKNLEEALDEYAGMPVLDETHHPFKTDVVLPGDMSRLKDVNEALTRAGIKVLEDIREVDVFVLSDKRP